MELSIVLHPLKYVAFCFWLYGVSQEEFSNKTIGAILFLIIIDFSISFATLE